MRFTRGGTRPCFPLGLAGAAALAGACGTPTFIVAGDAASDAPTTSDGGHDSSVPHDDATPEKDAGGCAVACSDGTCPTLDCASSSTCVDGCCDYALKAEGMACTNSSTMHPGVCDSKGHCGACTDSDLSLCPMPPPCYQAACNNTVCAEVEEGTNTTCMTMMMGVASLAGTCMNGKCIPSATK